MLEAGTRNHGQCWASGSMRTTKYADIYSQDWLSIECKPSIDWHCTLWLAAWKEHISSVEQGGYLRRQCTRTQHLSQVKAVTTHPSFDLCPASVRFCADLALAPSRGMGDGLLLQQLDAGGPAVAQGLGGPHALRLAVRGGRLPAAAAPLRGRAAGSRGAPRWKPR